MVYGENMEINSPIFILRVSNTDIMHEMHLIIDAQSSCSGGQVTSYEEQESLHREKVGMDSQQDFHTGNSCLCLIASTLTHFM